jgi:hypothetical protein
MKTKSKKLPTFKNEDEERNFWSTHDSTEYIDMSKLQRIRFPNLRRSKESVTLDKDLRNIFPDSKSVNNALRHIVAALPKTARKRAA